MQEVPVYRGSRAFLACERGRRRFTSLSQIWCETFVKRQKREKALESPVDREVWKWKRFFENTHARYTHARTFFSCRRWVLQLIQFCILLIQQRDSCSQKKVVPLLEKLYDFFSATAVSRARIAIIFFEKVFICNRSGEPPRHFSLLQNLVVSKISAIFAFKYCRCVVNGKAMA